MSLGTIHLDKGRWAIECEPHVRIRLQRLFGRAERSRSKAQRFYLSDTAENARELAWFIERYPLEVTPAEYLHQRAEAHRERERLVATMLSGDYRPREHQLAIPAREYQRLAADMWLAGGGLLLADDVGVGKTVSAICGLTDPRTRPALVVTLAHLPRQWAEEIWRFAPGLNVHVTRKGQPYDLAGSKRGQMALGCASPDVIITTYHKLRGWADALAGKVKSVVFDECQELRHREHGRTISRKYDAARTVAEQCEWRLGLSATPIFNYGGEIWNVLNILRPGALGHLSEFRAEWCDGNYQKPRIKDPRAFGTYARREGLMLRRTRAEVGRELPPLTRVIHEVDADTKPLDQVADRSTELARLILGQHESVRGEKWRAAEELTWLVRRATGVAKAPFVADFVRLLVDSGERVVLYGWHREVYEVWRERLSDISPVLYTGTESPTQKERAKQAFLAGESQVLIISLRSGAGLDGLQHACRTVVFGELDWSPAVHQQCEGRVSRDGQPDPVVSYYLTADSGSDPVVRDTLGIKREQVEGVVNPSEDLVEELQVDPDHVKHLAAALLRQRGLEVPAALGEVA